MYDSTSELLSRYGDRQTYSKDYWCVSVINDNKKIYGHSVIVVEGISDDNNRFIGYYDIYAIINENGSFNKYGYISKVRCRENTEYIDDYDDNPKKCFSMVEKNKVLEMIRSIHNDEIIVSKYLDNQGEPLKYQLIDESHILGATNRGNNCAGWCIKKLAICGLCDGKGKAIPTKVVMESTCNIL